MRIDAESISGYLYKQSGSGWADALLQPATPVVGGDLIVGKRYWLGGKPPTQNFAAYRGYVSFDTSVLSGKTVHLAWLVLTVKDRGADFADSLRVYSHGSAPWGDTLDSGDWDACDLLEGYLYPVGLEGVVWKSVDPASLNLEGQTQFRLRSDEVAPPAGEEAVTFHGAVGAPEGAYLVVDTGNINDDICTTLKTDVLAPHQSELGASAIHDKILHTVNNPPEIQIGWAGTRTENGEQFVSAEIWYLDVPVGGAGADDLSLDEGPRIKAGLLNKILRKDNSCGGLFTKCVSITEEIYDQLQWTINDDRLFRAALITVTYKRPIGGRGGI